MKCPKCGKNTYYFTEGCYQEGIKISPDTGGCSSCGYRYLEEAKQKQNNNGNMTNIQVLKKLIKNMLKQCEKESYYTQYGEGYKQGEIVILKDVLKLLP